MVFMEGPPRIGGNPGEPVPEVDPDDVTFLDDQPFKKALEIERVAAQAELLPVGPAAERGYGQVAGLNGRQEANSHLTFQRSPTVGPQQTVHLDLAFAPVLQK